jgi:hypothetical protein
MLDRSGSMTGEPLRQSQAALQQALRMLTSKVDIPIICCYRYSKPLCWQTQDYFTICAFDNEAIWLSNFSNGTPELLHATNDSITYACNWVTQVEARSLTDILTPYRLASEALLHPHTAGGMAPAQVSGPYKVRMPHSDPVTVS